VGSFNVSCGVSSIPIVEGDRTGVQILVESELAEVNNKESLVMSTSRLYKLFLAPIYGKYNSYGQIDSIESNNTVDSIESTYKMPIGKFLEAISDTRSVYDSFGALYEVFMKKDSLLDDYESSTVDILLSLGFTLKDKDVASKSKLKSEANAATLVYKNSEVVVSDNSIKEIYLDGKHLEGIWLYDGMIILSQLKSYSDATGLYPGVDEEYFNIIKGMSNFRMMFFNPRVVEEMDEYISSDSYANIFSERNEEKVREYEKLYSAVQETRKKFLDEKGDVDKELKNRTEFSQRIMESYSFFSSNLHHYMTLNEEYLTVNVLFSSEDYREILKLTRVMNYTSHLFIPSFYVSEDDPYDSALKLANITKSILEERRGQYSDDDS